MCLNYLQVEFEYEFGRFFGKKNLGFGSDLVVLMKAL